MKGEPILKGKLITIEGVEGCGKTTQVAKLHEWLSAKGIDVLATREPGGTVLGGSIRNLLLNSSPGAIQPTAELLLYAADRAQHVATVIRPNLNNGVWVICDRFTDSTMAYQGHGRGLDIDVIRQLNAIATGGLTPDLTLWLDVDVEVGLARAKGAGRGDRIEQEDIDFHRRVRSGYENLASLLPHRIVRIDASESVDVVANQIQQAVIEALFMQPQWISES